MRTLLVAAIAAGATVLSVAAGTVGASAQPAPQAVANGYTAVTPTRVVNAAVPARAKRTITLAQYAGTAGVALTLTVIDPKGNGSLVAYGGAGSVPGVTNLQITAGQKSADSAVVKPDSSGRITFYNNSSGAISLLVDVSGYYTGGSSDDVKSYHAVTPKRVVNTVTGGGGNHQGAIPAQGKINPRINGSNSGVPAGVGAIAITLTDSAATSTGYLLAGPYNLPIAPEGVLHWASGQRVSSFAIVPVDSTGQLTLTNKSSGSVQVSVDVVGYFTAGSPVVAGMLDNVPAARVYDTRSSTRLAPGSTRTVSVRGKGGLPLSGQPAAVLTLQALAPAQSGGLVAWGGGAKPGTTNLQFFAGHTTSNLAIVPLSGSGTISLYNGSAGSVDIIVDVTGYVLDSANAVSVPTPVQVGRYVQNLSPTNTAQNASTMAEEGQQDKSSDLVLLDIGAQLNDRSGVQLAETSTNLTYDTLVQAVDAYVEGYVKAGGDGTVAIGTNNDAADWTGYPAAARGADWANKVIDKIDAAGITIAGADDIEPAFGTGKVTDAQGWKQAYLAATSHPLIFNGSADGCPTDFGKPGATCLNGWTEWDLYRLGSGTRTTALPQIYNSRLAIQWANIDQTGRAMKQSGLVYAGALTEHPFDGSYTPANGYAALKHALSAIVTTPKIPAVMELHADAPKAPGLIVR